MVIVQCQTSRRQFYVISIISIVKHVDFSSVYRFFPVGLRVHQRGCARGTIDITPHWWFHPCQLYFLTQMRTQIKENEETNRITLMTPTISHIICPEGLSWSVETAKPKKNLDGIRCQSTGRSEENTTCPGLRGFLAGNDGVMTFRCFLNHHVGMFETRVPISLSSFSQ